MTEQLREKIAKIMQLEFGYVDWEDETQDKITRLFQTTDKILQVIEEEGYVCAGKATMSKFDEEKTLRDMFQIRGR